MRSIQGAGAAEAGDINVSPLIDMVFILLIFFIVTTVFVEERGLSVATMEHTTVTEPDDDPLVFTITSAGQVLHEDRVLEAGGVSRVVRAAEAKTPVIVKCLHGSQARLVVACIDEARAAGSASIRLAH
jgi:biopolymer transport protein ExbD